MKLLTYIVSGLPGYDNLAVSWKLSLSFQGDIPPKRSKEIAKTYQLFSEAVNGISFAIKGDGNGKRRALYLTAGIN